jgi:hypothetical protein
MVGEMNAVVMGSCGLLDYQPFGAGKGPFVKESTRIDRFFVADEAPLAAVVA